MLFFVIFLLVLVSIFAIALFQGGIFVCEDTAMMKAALGSFFGLYILTAIGLKIVLPTIPARRVDIRSVTGYWSDASVDIVELIRLPEPLVKGFALSGRL